MNEKSDTQQKGNLTLRAAVVFLPSAITARAVVRSLSRLSPRSR